MAEEHSKTAETTSGARARDEAIDDDACQVGSPSAEMSLEDAKAKVREMVTREEVLAKWKRLADEATAGPWRVVDFDKEDEWGRSCVMAEYTSVTDGDPKGEVSRADARFIAAARTAVPLLIAEVRRLRGMLGAEPPGRGTAALQRFIDALKEAQAREDAAEQPGRVWAESPEEIE